MTELTESPARFRDSKYTQNLTILRVAAGARCLCPSLEYPQVWVTNCNEIQVKPVHFEGQPEHITYVLLASSVTVANQSCSAAIELVLNHGEYLHETQISRRGITM